MTGLVLDASITACWLLPDETHESADLVEKRLLAERGHVPALWWFEVRNLLIVAERRGRIDAEWTARSLALLAVAPIDIHDNADDAALLELARKHRLTVYDAAYLELARRKGLPLATLDAELIAAARAERIALI